MKASLSLKDRLQKAGLKATTSRLSILEALESLQKPATLHEIFESIQAQKIDRVTLYRNLEAFEKAGLIEPIDLHQNQTYYELKIPNHDHHHIICLSCKKIEELELCAFKELQPLILKQAPDFASITHHSFEFSGLCRNCYA